MPTIPPRPQLVANPGPETLPTLELPPVFVLDPRRTSPDTITANLGSMNFERTATVLESVFFNTKPSSNQEQEEDMPTGGEPIGQ